VEKTFWIVSASRPEIDSTSMLCSGLFSSSTGTMSVTTTFSKALSSIRLQSRLVEKGVRRTGDHPCRGGFAKARPDPSRRPHCDARVRREHAGERPRPLTRHVLRGRHAGHRRTARTLQRQARPRESVRRLARHARSSREKRVLRARPARLPHTRYARPAADRVEGDVEPNVGPGSWRARRAAAAMRPPVRWPAETLGREAAQLRAHALDPDIAPLMALAAEPLDLSTPPTHNGPKPDEPPYLVAAPRRPDRPPDLILVAARVARRRAEVRREANQAARAAERKAGQAALAALIAAVPSPPPPQTRLRPLLASAAPYRFGNGLVTSRSATRRGRDARPERQANRRARTRAGLHSSA